MNAAAAPRADDHSATFVAGYAPARMAFLAAARARGLPVESFIHPLRGAHGEELALDVARYGPPEAHRLLIVSSGCHGIEGPAGSAVQRAAMADGVLLDACTTHGVALLFLHALNPHGWSALRRVTHENVDLNRNFHDFGRPLPANAAYAELHPVLLPRRWPPGPVNAARIVALIATRGLRVLQQGVSGGQYAFEDGLFYGGREPTWSNRTIRHVLRQHGAHARHIAWIDLHTGLGPRGIGERIFCGRDDPPAIARARRWWGRDAHRPVTSLLDGSSVSARLHGLMCHVAYDECPGASVTPLGIEFGTVPLLRVLQALRADHWLHLHRDEAQPQLAARIHAAMQDAFAPQDAAWQSAVLAQGREAIEQAVRGLGEER